MKCDECDGFGMLADTPERAPWHVWRGKEETVAVAWPVPCPRCGGTGISHCCEGDRCHPGDAE
jgi:hypothetical protein